MQTITLYLGLDVHKDSITIAIAEPGSKGEIGVEGVRPEKRAVKIHAPQMPRVGCLTASMG